MKNTTGLFIVLAISMFGCNQSSSTEEKENLTEAQIELDTAKVHRNEAAKVKLIADWEYFKNETDSSISKMENDLKQLQGQIENSTEKDKQKLKANYDKANSNLIKLKQKVHQKNIEFESSIKDFGDDASEKNQSFQREFKHDMDELGQAIKDLFKDNTK